MTDPELEQRAIDVIRGLAMDAPNRAKSGHQGTAMALAPLAHVLWTRVMSYDAADPGWPDRDRFVLSAGHASILQYSMLHLTGFGLTIEDIEQFRQMGSRTPGHPEVHHTRGVEVTTGPLGQGFANAVGMALAERWLAARFGDDLFDHFTFVIAGDGDLEEGLSHEAASFAGHQQLGKLVVVYDDNHITIDGPTELSLSDDAAERFRAYGWHVEELGEVANDVDALEAALNRAKAVTDKPSFLRLRSHIAYPSPTLTDDPEAHGLAFDDDTIREAKEVMGLPTDQEFWVPDDVLSFYRSAGERGRTRRDDWEKRLAAFSGDRAALDACLDGQGMPGWESAIPTFDVGAQIATRKASGAVLQALVGPVPGLVGGGADLTGNTGTKISGEGVMTPEDPGGRQVHFGVREHGMVAMMTGMALHGGVLPIGGTFLVFSDYARGALRLAAISAAKVIYSFTHDSVGVGEDGPTHQPIEQIASLRALPGLTVIRPADATETAAAWRIAIDNDMPTALILSRQDLPVLEGTNVDGAMRGGYAVVDEDDPDVVLVSTGSEVHVCVGAAEQLGADGVRARVVSLPSWDRFEDQDSTYQRSVLPDEVPTLAVEAGTPFGWDRYADDVVGIDGFGASAPGDEVLAHFGFRPDNVADRARTLIDQLTKER